MGPVLPLRVQVSVRKRHQPPAHGEQQPAADKRGGEDDQREAPFQVDQRGEHVLQEAALLADVLVRQVARAVFGDEARFVHAVPEHRLAGHAGGEPRQPKLLRDDAFPRQHLLLLLLKGREKKINCFNPTSVRNYARIQHVHLQEAKAHRLVSFCLGMFGSAPPLLSSSEGWDGLLSPVDVVQLPESRPAQTRTLLLPSRTEQGPSENTFQLKSTESKASIKNTFLNQCTFTYSL